MGLQLDQNLYPMRKLIAILYFTILYESNLAGQEKIIEQGRIVYTKTVNRNKIIGAMAKENSFYLKESKNLENSTHNLDFKYQLDFNDRYSLFYPLEKQNHDFESNPIYDVSTVVHNIYDQEELSIQKQVFETTYSIKGERPKIIWRLTGEYWKILNFNCRRINGMVQDSVYIVAFYSDQIPIPTGPETFFGLPGLVLEIYLPHENISWTATELIDQAPSWNKNIIFKTPHWNRESLKQEIEELKRDRSTTVRIIRNCLY